MAGNAQRAKRGTDRYTERVGEWDCPRTRTDSRERGNVVKFFVFSI